MRGILSHSILLAAAVSLLASGCDNGETREALKKQSDEIAAVKRQVDAIAAEQARTREAMAAKPASEDDRLFEAAVLLSKKAPDNASGQAIQLLAAVGGRKAEPVLLEMLEANPQNKSHAIFDALANIGSKKAKDVIMKFLSEGSEQQSGPAANALYNIRSASLFEKSDVDALEKLLVKYPNSDYGNSRYVRNGILRTITRLDEEKGVDIICVELSLPQRGNSRREALCISSERPLRLESWEKILKAVGPPDSSNAEVLTQILFVIARSGDWRMTDIILPWAWLAKSNHIFKQAYTEALFQLADPKAAKTLLELCSGEQLRRPLENYPGIKKDAAGKYVLADAAEMKKLLDARDKRIADFEAAAKKAAGGAKE